MRFISLFVFLSIINSISTVLRTFLLLYLLALLLTTTCHAQKNKFVRGKIITTSDTIECFIKEKDYYFNTIEYKLDNDTKETFTLKVKEVMALYDALNTYLKVRHGNNESLMKKVSHFDSPITLFEHIKPVHHASYGPSGQMNPGYNGYSSTFYIKKDDVIAELNRASFKKKLISLMGDHPKTKERINELKFSRLNYDLSRIVTDYNLSKKFSN